MVDATDVTENDRSYFRIDDDVILEYRLLSEGEIGHQRMASTLAGPSLQTLVNYVEAARARSRGLIERIREEDESLGEYLVHLAHILELLVRHFAGAEHEDTRHVLKQVNLSGSGIAFHLDDALPVGGHLVIGITFLPSYLFIQTLGSVVRCDKTGDADAPDPYEVGVKFLSLDDTVRDLLVSHVLDKQSEQLRHGHLHAPTTGP